MERRGRRGHTFGNVNISGSARGQLGDSFFTFNQYLSPGSGPEQPTLQYMSIPVAIRGLLSVSNELIRDLTAFIPRVHTAKPILRSIQAETRAFQRALASIATINPMGEEGSDDVLASESLVVSLTDAVLLLDEIKKELRPLMRCDRFGKRERLEWRDKQGRVMELMDCLQWHKGTVNLQLAILTAKATTEMRTSLQQAMDLKLSQDIDLAKRLEASKDGVACSNASDIFTARDPPKASSDNGPPEQTTASHQASAGSRLSFSLGPLRDFEWVLNQCRVYQRTQNREPWDVSMHSGTFRASMLSVLSRAKSSEISILSFVALPIELSDLATRAHYEKLSELRPSAGVSILAADDVNGMLSPETVEDPMYYRPRIGGDHWTPSLATLEDNPDIDEPSTEEREISAEEQQTSRQESSSSNSSENTVFPSDVTSSTASILYVCASLFDFDIDKSKKELGFPYLSYGQGEVFDVYAQKGELWLARNEDDQSETLGWIWEQHFVILTQY